MAQSSIKGIYIYIFCWIHWRLEDLMRKRHVLSLSLQTSCSTDIRLLSTITRGLHDCIKRVSSSRLGNLICKFNCFGLSFILLSIVGIIMSLIVNIYIYASEGWRPLLASILLLQLNCKSWTCWLLYRLFALCLWTAICFFLNQNTFGDYHTVLYGGNPISQKIKSYAHVVGIRSDRTVWIDCHSWSASNTHPIKR